MRNEVEQVYWEIKGDKERGKIKIFDQGRALASLEQIEQDDIPAIKQESMKICISREEMQVVYMQAT